MKLKLTFCLFKSFVRERKLLVSLMILSMVSIFIIMSFAYMSKAANDMIRQGTERDCGKCDIDIHYEDIEVRIKALAHKNVKDYYEYYRMPMYSTDITNSIFMEYCDEEYFQYSSYHCIEGEFPDSDNEVVCEPWYLRSIGISSENMIGAKIDVMGREYIVSGLMVNRGYSEGDLNDIIFLFKGKPGQINNHIMIDIDCDVTVELREEFYEYTLDSEFTNYVGLNADKMDTIQSIKKSTYLSSGFVIAVLLLSTMIILWNFILLFINRTSENINNFMRQGIPRYAIFNALSFALNSIVLIFSFISCGIYMLFSELLYECVIQVNKDNYEYVITSSVSKELVILFVGILLIEIFFIKIILMKRFFCKETRMTNKIGKVYSINPKKYDNNKYYLSMAKNNLRMSKGNNVLMIIALTIGIAAYLSVSYFISTIKLTQIDYGDTKYIIKFNYDFLLDDEELKIKSDLIDTMITDERFGGEIQNIYYTKSKFSKTKLSDECLEYLSLFYDYNALLGNNLVNDLSLRLAFVSLSEIEKEYKEKLNTVFEGNVEAKLEDYQGIFYSTSASCNIQDAIDIKVGEKIIIYNNDQKQVIDVVNVVDEIPMKIFSNNMAFLIIVNDKTFQTISDNQQPIRVYLTKDIPEQELIDYLKDISFVQIEKIDYDNQTVNDSAKEIHQILFVLLCVTITVLIVSLGVSCNTRIKIYKKEYKTLFSIGLPANKIIRIPIYEMILIAVPTVVLSYGVSYLATFSVHKLEKVKMLFKFSVAEWASVVIVFVIVMMACVLLNARTISKIKEE